MAEAANILSPVQQGVQIVTEMVQLGMSKAAYEEKVGALHGLMADAAVAEIRSALPEHVSIMAPQAIYDYVTAEENEGSIEAEAYWAATSKFFRRVYQACAAGCN